MSSPVAPRANRTLTSWRTLFLIVEVLSPSTERTDQREKRLNYQTVPAVREILLVAQDRRWIELYRRDRDGWSVEQISDEGTFDLASVGLTLSLDDLYRNTF